jgi:hypothetical protein
MKVDYCHAEQSEASRIFHGLEDEILRLRLRMTFAHTLARSEESCMLGCIQRQDFSAEFTLSEVERASK